MLLKTFIAISEIHSSHSSSSQFMMMSGESWWAAWLFWRTRRRWFAIKVPCTMKSLMVFIFDSWTALFLLSEFWYCTQNDGSFFADRLTFFGARVFTSGAMLRLQIISGVFWPSGDEGSELVVSGEQLLKFSEEKKLGENREIYEWRQAWPKNSKEKYFCEFFLDKTSSCGSCWNLSKTKIFCAPRDSVEIMMLEQMNIFEFIRKHSHSLEKRLIKKLFIWNDTRRRDKIEWGEFVSCVTRFI